MYLIDTNVISESRKGEKANQGVQEFWRSVDPDAVYLSVQTVGEIRRGIENIKNRGEASQAQVLEQWMNVVVTEYGDRILAFDADCAQIWGSLMSSHNQNPIAKQIAAIGLIHGLTVVTRNTNDFASSGVRLLNPFS